MKQMNPTERRQPAALTAISIASALVLLTAAGSQEPVPGTARATITARAVVADTATPQQLALGDRIFHGKAAGGLCFSCHGPKGKGMPGLGPDLTDSTWLHGDGSLDFVKSTIRTGVPKPMKTAAVMPPFGGSRPFTAGELDALAAYVFSLSKR